MVEIGTHFVNRESIKFISTNVDNSATVFFVDGTYLDIQFDDKTTMLKTLREIQ